VMSETHSSFGPRGSMSRAMLKWRKCGAITRPDKPEWRISLQTAFCHDPRYTLVID